MKNIIVFGLFALGLLISCNKDTFKKTIDSDILIAAKSENGRIYIDAETEKEYGCITYSILYSLLQKGNIINIDFLDVSKPDGCYAAFGPAETEIDLGELEQDNYTIVFKLNGVITEIRLNVNAILTLEIIRKGNVKLK